MDYDFPVDDLTRELEGSAPEMVRVLSGIANDSDVATCFRIMASDKFLNALSKNRRQQLEYAAYRHLKQKLDAFIASHSRGVVGDIEEEPEESVEPSSPPQDGVSAPVMVTGNLSPIVPPESQEPPKRIGEGLTLSEEVRKRLSEIIQSKRGN